MSLTLLLYWPQCVVQQATGLVTYSSTNFEPLLVCLLAVDFSHRLQIFFYQARPVIQMLK